MRDGIRDDEIITWFWRLVGDLQEEERGLLLRYVSLSHGIVMSLITLSYVSGCSYPIDNRTLETSSSDCIEEWRMLLWCMIFSLFSFLILVLLLFYHIPDCD